MGLLKRIPAVIGPVLLIYIFVKYIDIGEMIRVYGNASPLYLLVSWFFCTMLSLGKVHRIYFFMKRSSINIDFFSLVRLYVTANFLGQVSNILVADAINAGALMLHNGNKIRITNIFIFNRFSDLASILFLFLTFLCLNYGTIESHINFNYRPALLITLLFSLILLLAFVFRDKFLRVWKDLRQMIEGTIPAALLYSIFIYLSYCLSAIYDANALHIEAPKSYVLFSYMLGSLITILPISVAGIGTRDILFIYLLKLLDISPEKAVALSALGFLLIPYLSLAALYLLSLVGIRYENRRNSRCGERSGIS